jgi:hypothetical protein
MRKLRLEKVEKVVEESVPVSTRTNIQVPAVDSSLNVLHCILTC